MQRVGLADSPPPTAPSGFTVAVEPRSDASQGGPQPMMNYDNDSRDNVTFISHYSHLMTKAVGIGSSYFHSAYTSSNNHCSSSPLGWQGFQADAPLPILPPPFFFQGVPLHKPFMLLSVCFPESPASIVGTRSNPRKQEDGVRRLDHSPPG